MRIALTGGNGRVGKSVIACALEHGHQVVNIDRTAPTHPSRTQDLQFRKAELQDYDGLLNAMEGCEALIHLAAIPAPFNHPDHEVHNTNVVASYNAMRAAIELGITRICQASSVNAVGLAYSREPRFDYFPVDEAHPNYTEEPYGLSKWICEQQADTFVRRYDNLRIASMRYHWVLPERAVCAAEYRNSEESGRKNLWAYTRADVAAEATLLGVTADFEGHQVFYIAAPDTASDLPSLELAARHYPDVPIRGDLSGNRSFFSSAKAERLLGLHHPPG